MPWRPRKIACVQKESDKVANETSYFCQLELEKLDIFAEHELENLKLENSNLHSKKIDRVRNPD